jgi:oligopeptide/dipeptide ABC transporter ATP-binding protein
MTSRADPAILVQANGLMKEFPHQGPSLRSPAGARLRGRVKAVDGFELAVTTGEAVGVVGESGSGKTTVARCLLRLLKPTAGEILFDNRSVAALRGAELRAFRRDAQIVFQDPFASLDPRFTVQRALGEPLIVHRICSRDDVPDRAAQLLQQVGLKPEFLSRYRHELSGGEAQRVSVARALATNPRFLVLDEPTSALDASARLKVISLLRELKEALGMTYLVISHDLSVVRYLCDRVLVMYLGRVVEDAPAAELFARPRHPYTEALLSATPVLRGSGPSTRIRLREPVDVPPPEGGCPLAPRCRYALEECSTRPQSLMPVGPSHTIACHRVSEGQIDLDSANRIAASLEGAERA